MIKLKRIDEIEKLLREEEIVSLDKLCDLFQVSKATIRRDVNELEKHGSIKKIYGGIMLSQKDSQQHFQLSEKSIKCKRNAAKLASDLVVNGDVIYIDSGTTNMYLIPFLSKRMNLTIITANLYVISAALEYPQLNIISTGGILHRPSNAFVGSAVINFLQNYNISKRFFSSSGVSLTNGVTSAFPLEYEIKRYLIERGETNILLLDSSKVDVVSLKTFCRLDELDYFVTDQRPSKKYCDFFSANNVRLIIE
ncbi:MULTISPECIES: DeoR/GlpR family DNA-binding transcription regulator [Pelosinus]|jgi:DeoR family myo-inositol catabolism operon transcriptional repressor|uniref:Regulatory protein DeoR n=1 Tax=Pelosinus fermentans B4 TaxID=1149862 RepID=I9LES2_9FIRM|nr:MULTISPECIES: DeoR/GlpR family DNA-binding transcription regulator [Pelosinus]EIW18836.1 regulatory protein DeoR [Pelosinus fermentans B4]EIW21954.1 transcriptional regulator, DeoR family [Pelosinus fermentans A11]OAM95195.1 transcriptional regulator, DeoR family [Pelosinus fermentans DSM 17108]SDR24605.1 transcriptional regulator, DeoR family [Pelosinus fermentans]